jgi:hypothetical protein
MIWKRRTNIMLKFLVIYKVGNETLPIKVSADDEQEAVIQANKIAKGKGAQFISVEPYA